MRCRFRYWQLSYFGLLLSRTRFKCQRLQTIMTDFLIRGKACELFCFKLFWLEILKCFIRKSPINTLVLLFLFNYCKRYGFNKVPDFISLLRISNPFPYKQIMNKTLQPGFPPPQSQQDKFSLIVIDINSGIKNTFGLK